MTPWYAGVACFFGGAFLANAVPHLVAGVSGKALQTPFASPPFRGLSSPTVNVAWGLCNVAVAYLLLVRIGDFDLRSWPQVASCFTGFSAMAFQCARSFARIERERLDKAASPPNA